jgi:hypothetical protein
VELLDRAALSLLEYLTDIATNAPALLDRSFMLYFLAEFGRTTWPFMAVALLAARAHGSHTRVQGHRSWRGASGEQHRRPDVRQVSVQLIWGWNR